jgi:hypothetical protein
MSPFTGMYAPWKLALNEVYKKKERKKGCLP